MIQINNKLHSNINTILKHKVFNLYTSKIEIEVKDSFIEIEDIWNPILEDNVLILNKYFKIPIINNNISDSIIEYRYSIKDIINILCERIEDSNSINYKKFIEWSKFAKDTESKILNQEENGI